METCRRTIAKTVSYRILGGFITLGVAYSATGRIGAAAAIGVFDTLVKLGAFYFHERPWLRINYGRVEGPDYQI
jgi:uncharacterized membrane protein